MSYKETVIRKIYEAAAKTFGCDTSNFSPLTNFGKDFNAKSINIVQIIGVLEDEYEVEIDFMKFRNTSNIEEAAEYVAGLL